MADRDLEHLHRQGGGQRRGRFAAESFCSGSSWCSGCSGNGFAFDDSDASSTWGAHSVDRDAAALGAGPHTFPVEAQIVGGTTSSLFRFDDATLVLQTIG